MPEFAEVQVQVRYLRDRCRNWTIDTFGCTGGQHFKTAQDRERTLEEFLVGNTIEDITQRGKQVIMRTERGVMLSHLMFRGRWSVQDDPFISNYKYHKAQPKDSTRTFWITERGGKRLNFHTPEWKAKLTAFPGASDPGTIANLTKLGPEVLTTPETDPAFANPAWDLATFMGKANKSRQAIKPFLLDQKKQSGLGNMYVSEALYHARVNPARPANTLSDQELERVHHHAGQVLQEAMETNLDYSTILRVYRREHDPEGNAVEVTKISGRDSFWVPALQV